MSNFNKPANPRSGLRAFFTILSLVFVLGLLVSMAGCGKRGDPYRPSDAPSASNRY